MRLYILQNGLKDRHSHYLDETIAWRSAVNNLNFEWSCYAHHQLPAELEKITAAKPVFRIQPDVIIEKDPQLREISDFLDIAMSFAADCRKIFCGDIRSTDIILIPYATEKEILGLALWLNQIEKSHRPKIAFIVHRPEFSWQISPDRKNCKGDFRYWRYAMNRLVTASSGRILAASTNPRLADLLTSGTKQKFYPIGMPTFDTSSPPSPAPTKDIDLGMVGEFRSERGSDFIAQTLIESAIAMPETRYLVQVKTLQQAEKLQAEFAEAGRKDSLKVAVGDIDSARFLFNLRRCRWLVAPYHPERYRMRSSGVFSQAAGYGIPMLVPEGTWLADRVVEGTARGKLVKEFNASVIKSAIKTNHEYIQPDQESDKISCAWREKNSSQAVLRDILNRLMVFP